LLHAGALWRDEAAGVQLATLPGLSEMWRMLTHDSFPVLFPLVVRIWAAIGLGGSDLHLRWLGFAVGLTMLASFWVAARLMGRGVPIISLALFALNLTCIRSGDSLRAYGLGCALIVVTLALVWKFTQKRTPANGLLAAVAAILSVQCLYQNAFLVLAICGGACIFCYSQERWRTCFWILGIGTAAALSLVPYLGPIARAQNWWMLEKTGFHPDLLWANASQAMAFPSEGFDLIWMLLLMLAVGYGVVVLGLGAKTSVIREQRDLAMVVLVALVAGLVGFGFFLRIALLPTQPWYYLPIMAFVAACLDAIGARCDWRMRAGLIVFAVITAVVGYAVARPAMSCRQTNMDVVAAQLAKEASPKDLILVHPWYCGISFQRYYHGETAWTTLPPLEDHLTHRYDLLKVKMQMDDPIQPVLDKIASTLESGNRVWVVGKLPGDGQPPSEIHPAPDNPWSWCDEPYSSIWGARTAYFLLTHSIQNSDVVIPSADCVSPYENLPVLVFSSLQVSPPDTVPSTKVPSREQQREQQH